MTISVIILLLAGLLPGLAVFFVPAMEQQRFKTLLAFSGAYLFSITVIHILPELFEARSIVNTGIFVLGGFFLQMILEYFSSGIEHGHIHNHEEDRSILPYSMLISLCLHAFLEGTLLTHPMHSEVHGDNQPLLFGLALHKIPEAFALMSVLVFRLGKTGLSLFLLFIFAAASPLGLLVSDYLFFNNFIPADIFTMLFALVAGNFLYISTTIFFENSPNHTFKARKLLISLFGALVAIAIDYLL